MLLVRLFKSVFCFCNLYIYILIIKVSLDNVNPLSEGYILKVY